MERSTHQAFVKAGASVRRRAGSAPLQQDFGLLSEARDWECDFDLPEWRSADSKQLVFPHDVCATSLRIDGYLVSRSKRICVAGPELTAPMEENVAAWAVSKRTKYSEIQKDAAVGWRVHVVTLEVGSRGWIPPAFRQSLLQLGFTTAESKSLADKCQLVARRCSYIIWLNRFNREFQPWRISAE